LIDSRAIAANMTGVSDTYVSHAGRIKEAPPELSEDVRTGRFTLSEALHQLEGITDDPATTRLKTVRGRLNKLLRSPEQAPAVLDRLEALVAEFAEV